MVEIRNVTNLLPSSHHKRFFWRLTPWTLLLRLCENVTVIACRFADFPVRSQIRVRIIMVPLVDSRLGADGTSAARVEPKKLEDGINASTPTRAAMKASTERRTIETIREG